MIAELLMVFGTVHVACGFGWQGKYDFTLDQDRNYFAIFNRGFYNQTLIQLKVECLEDAVVEIGWVLRLSECANEFYRSGEQPDEDIALQMFENPDISFGPSTKLAFIKHPIKEYTCHHSITFVEMVPSELHYVNMKKSPTEFDRRRRDSPQSATFPSISAYPTDSPNYPTDSPNYPTQSTGRPNPTYPISNNTEEVFNHLNVNNDHIAQTWANGPYSFFLVTRSVNKRNYQLRVTIAFKYHGGYLSAYDWPFLPFYSIMCAVYSGFALFWTISSFVYWRDMLRIQIWIGAVILLGLMEKAAFLAEYEGINRHGYAYKYAVITAEIISCLKRSLARMLVILVSVGFGITKPRLGSTMSKILTAGGVYFVFALIDSLFRVIERKENTDSKGALAGVPLVFIDVAISYWIATSLQQTMHTLRLRRNVTKLTLYRHFANTLAFCLVASVIFMIWSIFRFRFVDCLKDWEELWLDDAFWHILFSFILLIIIILWRPSKNSQRYAFSPLIDNEDFDDDDDEMAENELFDSTKMRTRTSSGRDSSKPTSSSQARSIEDELKWVEENVPSSFAETALPGIVDSDEELATTRLEMSKMD
nr:G protein-coupled receptor [Proales similis]